MPEERLVIIGCDDGTTMLSILNYLKETVVFKASVISATRSSDLITIVRAMQPDLVILCFRNNQVVIGDFNVFVKKPDIPILCISRKFENEVFNQAQKHIIFSYPFDHLIHYDHFISTINSIFLLREKVPSTHITTYLKSVESPAAVTDNRQNIGRYALELDQKVELLLKVKNRISCLYAEVDQPIKAELTSIVNSIKQVAQDHKLWDDFKLYFEQVNPKFLSNLMNQYPALTPIDLKYCCYMLMNMSNDDIRRLLGINQESVRTHKYRLKKKMLLSKNQDLQHFLRSVS
ncbi:hypothetical protein G6M26_20980 [Agrobacterium tumefaciens]|nr:hypothetical protein [Agrobacterium tumefaciens]NTE21013.1 hypothetical protein [Agrobacterium tumefaciens]